MSIWLIGSRCAVPNRSGNKEDDDEKVKVVGYGRTNHHYQVKFSDGTIKEVYEPDMLVDTDHQTCLDIEEQGGDHLLSLTFKPIPAIDPTVEDYPGDGLRKGVKLRLDVLALAMEAISMYPNTGAAIGVLVKNLPSNNPGYQPFIRDSKVPHTWDDRLFLVRPRGLHPGTGRVYAPSVVHLIDGQLFTDMNELEPLTWSKNGDIRQGPTNDPYEANLEWMTLPE